MEGSRRGRRGKKAGWQVSVGVKDAIFAGVGVVGLMMISFALGVLAGRGDIYRVFYQWGLLSPDAPRVAHWLPPAGTSGPVPPGAAAPGSGAPASPAAIPAAATAGKATAPAPVTGSIAATPGKGKGSALGKERKDREEELRRVRQEVVRKLKFQNSLDSQPKAAKAPVKPKEKTALIKVAQFRDMKAAKAKVAELQKKGIKVTLKEGKDQKGPWYTVYRQGPATSPGTEALAQSGEKKRKAQAE